MDVFDYLNYRAFLRDYYVERKRKGKVSFRSFSQRAGLKSPNYLKLVMDGERNLGADTPLHFSRFAPLYKLEHLPPTPPETLERLAAVAAEEGVRHIYVGNVYGTSRQDTKCSRCGENVVSRRGFFVAANLLAATGGLCPKCGERVAGVWT